TTYYMSLFNLQTDFWTFVWPRVALGFGMACIFIPLTTLTLSHIPKPNMGEATSLYNLIRNMGGSIGIAFATTMAARRAQFHQFRLSEHLTPFDPSYVIGKAKAAAILSSKGIFNFPPDAGIYRQLLIQSNMLGFNDSFFMISMMLFAVLPLVLILKLPEDYGPGRKSRLTRSGHRLKEN
ncbi:MAG: hypothetical protein ACC669_09505, partial [bacterium]